MLLGEKKQAIDILVMEHENVLELVDIVKTKCKKIMNGEEIVIEFFKKVLDLGRNYVDGHHHKKEEDILFEMMIEKLGEPISHVIKDGMLFEHNVGRMFLMNLEFAIMDFEKLVDEDSKLKILSNAYGYVDMMENHVEKENEIIYPFAEQNLTIIDQEDINKKFETFEENAAQSGVQSKYLTILSEIK